MKIENIFKGINYEIVNLVEDNNFNEIQYDSRKISNGDIFVALIGTNSDGHKYIDDVVKKGASMIIVERDDITYPSNISVIKVKDLRDNLGAIASNYYNHPQDKLKIVGITGTNGKTTSTYILESILENSSRIGTTGYRILDENYEAVNTTPESLDLIKMMKESVDKGVEYFLMEVSSHALCSGRVNMLRFDSAIFTNLTQDHLDFHETMENYFKAKASILNLLKDGARLIVNKDDDYCRRLLNVADSFSLEEEASITGKIIEYTLNGMRVSIKKDGKEYEFVTKLVGRYNLQNILGVIQSSLNLGIDMEVILEKLKGIKSIAGRFEIIENDRKVMVVVDYAHTPDGLDNILKTLLQMKKSRIITLFGAGGDRDKTKRPKMAAVASKYSDYVFITSDNPRTENPENILKDIEKGMSNSVKYTMIVDRKEAIKQAIESLKENDILLIAGKGHEDYQILGTTKIHFDDREIARKYLGGR